MGSKTGKLTKPKLSITDNQINQEVQSSEIHRDHQIKIPQLQQQAYPLEGSWDDESEEFVLPSKLDFKKACLETQQQVDNVLKKLAEMKIFPNKGETYFTIQEEQTQLRENNMISSKSRSFSQKQLTNRQRGDQSCEISKSYYYPQTCEIPQSRRKNIIKTHRLNDSLQKLKVIKTNRLSLHQSMNGAGQEGEENSKECEKNMEYDEQYCINKRLKIPKKDIIQKRNNKDNKDKDNVSGIVSNKKESQSDELVKEQQLELIHKQKIQILRGKYFNKNTYI